MFYDALKKQWDLIVSKHNVTELWLPVGSGTLARTFAQIVPDNIPIYCVTVNVINEKHELILDVKNNKKITQLYYAPENFSEKAGVAPPIPSNIYYDAKIFRFVEKYAKDGALWWNVAK
jgi:UDP-N-acetylglucosamine pyrophosphorylase